MARLEPGIKKLPGKKGNTYRVQIRLKGHPHTSKNFDNYDDAKEWRFKTIEAIKSHLPYETTRMRRTTLGDLIDRYIASEMDEESSNYQTRLGQLKWWKEEIGHCILPKITEDLICKCRDKLLKTTDQFGRSRSKATFNRYRTSLSCVFNVALKEWRLIPSSPIKNIRKLKENKPRCRILDKEERSALLEACSKSRNEYLLAIVLIALSCGMRKSEILELKWKDTDLKNQLIHLENTKNGDRRIVPMNNDITSILRKRAPSSKESLESFVFPGKTLSQPVEIRSAWETALRESGIKNFRFHDLRHCAASLYMQLGYPLQAVSKLLGHRTISLTNMYSHLVLDQSVEATGRLGEFLSEEISVFI
ncbi:MAG: site-specific integrase [Simkaniaceae bacterium]|nr:site-specific integrase [Candidatus Sacchlamyda saccharinae]